MPITPRFRPPFRVVHSRRPARERAQHLEIVRPPPEPEDPVMEEARAAFERLFESRGA